MVGLAEDSHNASDDDEAWIEAGLGGNRVALARILSVVENQAVELPLVLQKVLPRTGRALRIGFTGAPGVGKSSLVGAYVAELRRRGRSVGVVAIDPSSIQTGGAILGDRVRMTQKTADPGVFIRSLAARGQLGGIVGSAMIATDVFDAAGWDVVVVETVGVGQSEIDVAGIVHCTVVVCAPGMGDEVQGIKAGILEIADVLVLNKSDLPAASAALAQLQRVAHRLAAGGRAIPVVRTIATKGEGTAELVGTLDAAAAAARGHCSGVGMQLLLRRFASHYLDRWFESAPELADLCARVAHGCLSLEHAVGVVLASASASIDQSDAAAAPIWRSSTNRGRHTCQGAIDAV